MLWTNPIFGTIEKVEMNNTWKPHAIFDIINEKQVFLAKVAFQVSKGTSAL